MSEKSHETKGWKINLAPYKHKAFLFTDKGSPVMRGFEQAMEDVDFDVKESLAGLCFSKALMLDPDAMFKAKAIADKIRSAKNSVILDNEQMEHVLSAYKQLKGLPEDFIEFLGRIRNAEEVSLKEALEK